MIPRATYRLQFHKDFTFADATPLAPYLARLGVSHVYASPIGAARAGSTHGYDQVDPTVINPELGGEAGFRSLAAALKAQGLGVVLDIVPNHMAVGGDDNRWWLDVLEHGPSSRFAQMFDIDWDPIDPELKGRVLAPFLGAPYAEVLESGELKLEQDPASSKLSVTAYGAHRFPIRPEDQAGALADGLDAYDSTKPDGRARLHALLERQHYRLAWWRTAGDEINWRRFFDVTELAGVRTERDEVFDLIHALPLRLYAEGLIDGVRVDHVDGLADPAAYCRKLRAALADAETRRPPDAEPGPAYFVVEKILAPQERLSADWGADGTTGYDYMNESAALLHDHTGEGELTRYWTEISGRSGVFEPEERAARLQMLEWSFSGQLEAAVRAFHRVARSELATRDITAAALRRALTTQLSVFPAYRTYGVGDSAPASDRPLLDHAVERAKAHAAPGEAELLDQVAAWLLGHGPAEETAVQLRREAVRRFQQLSAPVSAKSVEDTAFYRYGRLLSRNDVGFDPNRLAASTAQFHQANAERAETFPHALLTTATHDHKRGEDVRARLAVLSEIPEVWTERAWRWTGLNAGLDAPVDPADAYQLHQTLVGAWPLDLRPDDASGLAAFRDRVAGWQQKALREAKLRSSWVAPDETYEAACRHYLDQAMDPSLSAAFLEDLAGFVDQIAPAGALNGLVQTLLRCTVPGVPDTYQGTEFWDLSLVDPDNRRPVDFAARRAALDAEIAPADLLAAWRDGRVKQALIARALAFRRDAPALFADGGYLPLALEGHQAHRALAFARLAPGGGERAIVVVPLHSAAVLLGRDTPAPAAETWGDTLVRLPPELTGRARDRLNEGECALAADQPLAELLDRFPLALLHLR